MKEVLPVTRICSVQSATHFRNSYNARSNLEIARTISELRAITLIVQLEIGLEVNVRYHMQVTGHTHTS